MTTHSGTLTLNPSPARRRETQKSPEISRYFPTMITKRIVDTIIKITKHFKTHHNIVHKRAQTALHNMIR